MNNMWEDAFGYKKIEAFFSISAIEKIKKCIDKLTNEEDRKNYVWKYYEKDKKTINRIEYFVNYDETLHSVALDKNILKEVHKLLKDDPCLFKDKINFKYPGALGFTAHQDITAGWGKYSNKHVSVAIPLCDTNDKNGCLMFGEKTKTKLTEDHRDLERSAATNPCYTKTGDIIFFDSYAPHASYENNSSEKRPILFFTYTPKSEGNYYEIYHADKFKNVPPDIYKIKGRKYRSGNSNSLETEY